MRNLYYAKVLFAAFLGTTVAASQPLDEAKVFEWWDSGMIDSDEAQEILTQLEEDNQQEACLLAEVYALESCASPELKSKAKKDNSRPNLVPHGYIEWRGRTDSLGHLESQRAELRLNFYRYSLRLGSQSLLTYKNAGSEAHLGQVSTKELHSTIPLDTLWGTTAIYPLGMFRIGGLLDTAKTTRASIGLTANRELEIIAAYWHHSHPATRISETSEFHPADNFSAERHSVSAQFKGDWGNFTAWWIPKNGADLPLMKIQLLHRERTVFATIAWKADAYAHGKQLPQESHLSSTIARSRFWGSQTFSATAADSWRSKFALSARTIIPLEGDTSKTRFKATTESGPQHLRGGASATCLQAEERCRRNDLALKISSTWNIAGGASPAVQRLREQLAFTGKIRARHTRGQGFAPPLYEAGAAYSIDAFNSAGVAVAIPKGSPARELQIRNTAEVGTDFLQLSLTVTFRRTAETPLHPLHAALKARIMF